MSIYLDYFRHIEFSRLYFEVLGDGTLDNLARLVERGQLRRVCLAEIHAVAIFALVESLDLQQAVDFALQIFQK